MTSDFLAQLPESVRWYLSDPATEASVHHLLAVKKDGLPQGLSWPEFEDFLPARAAAHLTRAEYSIGLWSFWKLIWKDTTGPSWRMASPDENGAELIGPITCWEDQNLAVRYDHVSKNGLEFYTLVGMTGTSTAIGFALENQKGSLIAQSEGSFEFRDDEYDDYLVKEWPRSICEPEFPWAEVFAARDEAIALVQERT